MDYIFGPVPSRRLGLSLGVDLVTYKTCSLDCIYCECGKTTNLTITRQSYVNKDLVLDELDKKLKTISKLDFITFSGSGEPTLSSDLGYISKKIKEKYNYKIAVLTNGTLLYLKEVQKDLEYVDLVIPSLDAVDKNTFNKINKPSKKLDIKKIINGLIEFSNLFKGEIWLEILFVKDINDNYNEIDKMIKVIKQMKINKIQLNTNVRPGTEKNLNCITDKKMYEIKKYMATNGIDENIIELTASFNKKTNIELDIDFIVSTIKRRPLSIDDLVKLTNKSKLEIIKTIDYLKKDYKIETQINNNKEFFKII